MSITGYIPTLEASFIFTDNSGTATKWGYQLVGYLQKNGTTNKFRYPQGRIDASTLTNGSTQTVRFPGITPGTSYDGFVALADLQGSETAQVALFTNYAVPKVASGSPVGPIWGKLHHLPVSTDPTNGTWNTGSNTFDRGAHHPSLTGAIDPSSNLLTTEFSAQTITMNSGTYAGLQKMAVAQVKSATGHTLKTGQYLWQEWVAWYNSTGTFGYGPAFFDDAGNHISVDTYSGAGNLYYNATNLGALAANVANNGAPHHFKMGIAYLSGSNPTAVFSIVAYVDDVLVWNANVTCDFEGHAYPGFIADSSGQVYFRDFEITVGSRPYHQHDPVFRDLVNLDGTAAKTTDWLPEGTNKYAAEHGADITGNHTANDTSHVNGVASSSISPIATLMPAEAGADVTANHNSAGTGSGGNARSAANLAAIVGTDNAIPSSTPWKAHILNSLANLISNITVHTYSASSGALSMWFTSTSNSSSPGGSTYPAWTYPDGSGAIYPGHTNGYSYVNGTSQTAAAENNSFQWTGLGSGGVYIGVKYDIASDAFSIVYGPSSTAPTDAQIASVAGDGSICTVIASATTNSIIATSGGGGSSFTGGGGRQRQ